MIQIKVLNSPDEDKIGSVLFNKNLIYIGNNHSCDLNLEDSKLILNHLIVEVAEGKLLAHPHRDVPYFLVNGKRCTGIKSLSVNDKVKIGDCDFVIENFAQTQIVEYKKFLNDLTDELINTNSPILEIIQKVQKS